MCMHLMDLGCCSACAFHGILLVLFKGFFGLEGDGYFVTFKENLFLKDMVAVLLLEITSYRNHLTEVRG